MTGLVLVKAGVRFTTIAPAGFRLLAAIERAARGLRLELTITSACDGPHSGPGDPHKLGEAYDLQSHAFGVGLKRTVLRAILLDCCEPDEAPAERVGLLWITTAYFFGFLEATETPNEHFHLQRRKGTTYP